MKRNINLKVFSPNPTQSRTPTKLQRVSHLVEQKSKEVEPKEVDQGFTIDEDVLAMLYIFAGNEKWYPAKITKIDESENYKVKVLFDLIENQSEREELLQFYKDKGYNISTKTFSVRQEDLRKMSAHQPDFGFDSVYAGGKITKRKNGTRRKQKRVKTNKKQRKSRR